jgi:hypothetical protein
MAQWISTFIRWASFVPPLSRCRPITSRRCYSARHITRLSQWHDSEAYCLLRSEDTDLFSYVPTFRRNLLCLQINLLLWIYDTNYTI